MHNLLFTPLFVLGIVLPLTAGEVVLKNGSIVKGKVIDKGEVIELEFEFGKMSFRRDEVKEVIPGKSPLEELRERVAALDPGDAEGHYQAGLWAAENELPASAQRLFAVAIEIDANHAGARAKLGFHLHDGRWLTADEYLMAQGFVQFRGEWVREAERDEILAREEAERERDHASDLANEVAQLRERVAAAEHAVQEAKEEAARAKSELERYKSDAESSRIVIVCHTCKQPRRCACMPQRN
ncbi:MAG: hypothetical protein L0Z55_10700 [Planctomycetes bacterium]|nr:hypothetical protein [Planctomycetota bacterium]